MFFLKVHSKIYVIYVGLKLNILIMPYLKWAIKLLLCALKVNLKCVFKKCVNKRYYASLKCTMILVYSRRDQSAL